MAYYVMNDFDKIKTREQLLEVARLIEIRAKEISSEAYDPDVNPAYLPILAKESLSLTKLFKFIEVTFNNL